MAVLGRGGKLNLQREAPTAVALDPTSLNTTTNTIPVSAPGFWSGDQVTLTSPIGLPIDTQTEGADGPDCPDGHAVFAGSRWHKGSNRKHLIEEDDAFYSTSDATAFYMRPQDCWQTTAATYYIYRDQNDGVSFYTTRSAALGGRPADRIQLYQVGCFGLQMLFAETSDAWRVQGLLREWVLNLNATEIDTTSVGERFGDSVKSIVTGGGSLDFLIDRLKTGDESVDSTQLLKLLLLTERGSKASAEFWMIEDREELGVLAAGDLFYETSFLVTSCAVNTRADDIIAGSLNFVTVGEIALRMGES